MTSPREFYFDEDDRLTIRQSNLLRRIEVYTLRGFDYLLYNVLTREYLYSKGWTDRDMRGFEVYFKKAFGYRIVFLTQEEWKKEYGE